MLATFCCFQCFFIIMSLKIKEFRIAGPKVCCSPMGGGGSGRFQTGVQEEF